MRTGHGTILLVDDDRNLSMLFLEMLRRDGIENEVVIAHDGVEALDYLFGEGKFAGRDTNVMPSLVLLDINMPRMDGLETLRRIRTDDRTKYLPVVMFTSSNHPQDIKEANDAGANAYVDKASNVPFSELVPLMVRFWTGLHQCSHT